MENLRAPQKSLVPLRVPNLSKDKHSPLSRLQRARRSLTWSPNRDTKGTERHILTCLTSARSALCSWPLPGPRGRRLQSFSFCLRGKTWPPDFLSVDPHAPGTEPGRCAVDGWTDRSRARTVGPVRRSTRTDTPRCLAMDNPLLGGTSPPR